MDARHTVSNEASLAIGETARRLGVAVETIRRWESQGVIASTRTPGGQRRFPVSEVERVAAERVA